MENDRCDAGVCDPVSDDRCQDATGTSAQSSEHECPGSRKKHTGSASGKAMGMLKPEGDRLGFFRAPHETHHRPRGNDRSLCSRVLDDLHFLFASTTDVSTWRSGIFQNRRRSKFFSSVETRSYPCR